jgi:hypothetical protein
MRAPAEIFKNRKLYKRSKKLICAPNTDILVGEVSINYLHIFKRSCQFLWLQFLDRFMREACLFYTLFKARSLKHATTVITLK